MADAADTAQALMDRAVADGDPRLAEAIGRFARSREYGLVFEHNRLEAMGLYGKPIKPGDLVNVLPERGKREEPANRVPWLVENVDVETGRAMLRPVGRADDSTGVVLLVSPIWWRSRTRGAYLPGVEGNWPCRTRRR